MKNIIVPVDFSDTSVNAAKYAIEMAKNIPDAKITLFGSFVSTEALKAHKNCLHVNVDHSKKSKCRFFWLYRTVKDLGDFDIAISFRSSFVSSFLLWFLKAKKKFHYKKNLYHGHQVEKYFQFIDNSLHVKSKPDALTLYQNPYPFKKKTLGLNPGATYGSAKRWYPEEFAKVAVHFSNRYDIVILGGPTEIDIAKEVEETLKSLHVKTKTTSTKGGLYISGHGYQDMMLENGEFKKEINKKLTQERTRIMVSVGNALSTKLLVIDKH